MAYSSLITGENPIFFAMGQAVSAFRLRLLLGLRLLLLFNLLLLLNLLLLPNPLALLSLVRPFVPQGRYADQLSPIVSVGKVTGEGKETLGLAAISLRTHEPGP
jgi:hypothetical protein